ncbi:hypothetical protein [Actinomadura sp. K4S16]|uniref:hypothetical protein n=1 Tax=Actinomadura sp. K4S16 TaxID=1316147 RepID=UPI0011EC87E1|nr:hypothetical protein [Actinomadura sp. K4S16]
MRGVRSTAIRSGALAITLAGLAAASPTTAAVAGTKATPPATSPGSPKWQLFNAPVQGSISLLSATAAGRNAAWAGGLLVNPRKPPRLARTPADDENCNFAKGMFTSVMLRWDGRSWRQVSIPNFARINQVSASSPKDVWASADCGLLHWNGQSWTPVPFAPIPGAEQTSAGSISAVGPEDAWLAGGTYDGGTGVGRGFVQHWDGRHWRNVPLPNLDGSFSLDGIDARGPRDVWAVGTDYPGDDVHPERLLLLHWNGRTWKRLPEPVTGYMTQRLARVRMVTGNDVWVSGWGKTTPGREALRHPMLLHWNGREWASAKVPDGRGELMDVAVSGRQALAGGDTVTPSEPSYTMLALRRTASGWQNAPVPVTGMATLAGLAPIPGGGLWGVGAITATSGDYQPLIARLK